MYKVIGIMSGTSMDGVDLAYCELENDNDKWSFEIKASETIPYDSKWRVRLSQLRKQSPNIFVKTDVFYGHYLGQLVNQFIAKHQLKPDLIGSHGHTVFHQPESGITSQIGDGAAIHAETGLPVVCNFRTVDVALKGQGAPLVPIGDKLLFGEYDLWLNLGGFANISARRDHGFIAYDICPANIVFNRVARNLGKNYDEGGAIAQKGSINYELLKLLNALKHYSKPYPKSLGREWINSEFWPVVRDFEQLSQEDTMKTLVDHVASQIARNLDQLCNNDPADKKVLVTGGGAYNETLIELLRTHSDADFVIPSEKIINYKEALIFALLAVLRVNNQPNCLSSVTGASRDNIGGALFGDFSSLV